MGSRYYKSQNKYMCTASKQARKQAGKIKIQKSPGFVSLKIVCWSQGSENFHYALTTPPPPKCGVQANQIPVLQYKQPAAPTVTHPAQLALEKTPKNVCPQALQISIRKKLSQVFQKHPRCLQISIFKKKAFPKCCRNTQDICKSQNIYIFSKCFELTKQFPFTNPVPTTLRRTHTQELVTHLTFVKKERVHKSFNIFSLGWRRKQFCLSIYRRKRVFR